MECNNSNLDSLNDLLDIADALGLSRRTVSRWLQAMARFSGFDLARFCSQRPPHVWAGGDPTQDALDWVNGNPNGFGYQRALDALRCWGAAWPGDHPISAQWFSRELLLGQAVAMFFGRCPSACGMAPAIRDGGVWVLRYAANGDDTAWEATPRDAAIFRTGADWDYDRFGLGPIRAQTTGLPSLASARLALDIMLGAGDHGAGWVAGASR
jgi:hypothetical protein